MHLKIKSKVVLIRIGLTGTPPVLLMHGLGQFKVSALVCRWLASSCFGYFTAVARAIMSGLVPGSGSVARFCLKPGDT